MPMYFIEVIFFLLVHHWYYVWRNNGNKQLINNLIVHSNSKYIWDWISEVEHIVIVH